MNKNFNVGDTVRVYQKIYEGDKQRAQIFEGVVISIKGREENRMFTVRRVGSASVGIERIWPLHSPHIEKIVVKSKGRVRRAKLYYLRSLKGKDLKLKERITNEPPKPRQARGRKSKTVSTK